MAAPIFNQTVFREDMLQAINGSRFIDQAFEVADAIFQQDKDTFIEDIISSPITQSLSQGSENPQDYTDSLVRGAEGSANLFAYLGFELENGNPITPVLDVLKNDIHLNKTSLGARYNRDNIRYEFSVSYPTKEELYYVAPPLKWIDKSWLKTVEDGVDSHTLFKFGSFSNPPSRSTAGIQVKDDTSHPTYYRPPSDGYVLTKIDKFINKYR